MGTGTKTKLSVNNNKIKRPGEVQKITAEQAEEYLHCQNDPLYFIENYVKITDIDKGIVPFQMYDFQKDMVRNFHEKRWSINLASRQVGKCLNKDINITVKHKETGDVYELPIGDFFEMQKNRERNQ